MPKRVGVIVKPEHIPGSQAVFNAAVHYHEGDKQFDLFCRVVDNRGISSVQCVTLDSNYKIVSVSQSPLLVGANDMESLGCEDPRLTDFSSAADPHLLTYTAVSRSETGWHTLIGIATSEDLVKCQRLGFFPGRGNNKNGVFLPKKINDSYCLYHRIHPDVWIAFSPDLVNWQNIRPVMFTRPGWWDGVRIGIGTVLPTDDGWLAFYHGADPANTYRLGAALFDQEKPWKLLARSYQPLLEPGTKYEKVGPVPNIVFTCGAFARDGIYSIVYGAADRVTAACEFTKKEVKANLRPI